MSVFGEVRQSLFELLAKGLLDNRPIILKDLLNEWFRGGGRNRKVVGERMVKCAVLYPPSDPLKKLAASCCDHGIF
jgi:hypothetical protein